MAEKGKIFYLEMQDRSQLAPSAELGEALSIELLSKPDWQVNRRFYHEVGAPFQWGDRLPWTERQWSGYVGDPRLRTYLAFWQGQEIGYCELLIEDEGEVEIVYFGLLEDFIGRGLGGAFLSEMVKRAWDLPGAHRVWLHTCSNDHENAVANYQARGFSLYRVETEA